MKKLYVVLTKGLVTQLSTLIVQYYPSTGVDI